MSETDPSDESVLRVVKGDPTPEELAAVVAVVAARATAPASSDPARSTSSAWADPAARHRAAHRPGPDAWRRSVSR